MIYINLSDVSIFNIKDADYRCNISGVNKSDATILSKNRFDQKKQNVIKHKFITTYENGIRNFNVWGY